MQTLKVDLAERGYPIYIGEGILAQADLLRRHIGGRQVAIVTNETIAPLYLERLLQSLDGFSVTSIVLPDGEAHKDWPTLQLIFDGLLQARHDRRTTLIALGGGVIGDMTGFAAACYQRGVDYRGREEIPYQEASSSGATSTSFKEAALSLEVTPQITPDNRVIMEVKVTKDAPNYQRAINGVPPIDKNEVNAKVLVDNGETVVIGGVFSNTQSKAVDKVPFLGDVPYVGRLFRRDRVTDEKTELLIFLTPSIIDHQAIAVSR